MIRRIFLFLNEHGNSLRKLFLSIFHMDCVPDLRSEKQRIISLAPQVQIANFEELSQDFLLRIFDVEAALITDESSLWDFHMEETNECLCARILEVYGVDVSDIKSGNLVEIFRRISLAK